MEIKAFLREVTAKRGLSGDERPVAQWVAERFKEHCDEVKIDAMNSVVGRIKGEGPRLAFVAHLDEVGLMVIKIEEDGCLRLGQVGGIDPRILPGMRLTVYGKETLPGIVGAKAPHLLSADEKNKALKLTDIYVDLALPVEKVRELVRVGDQVQLEHRFTELKNDRVSSKTLDDRCCVAILYRAMELLQGLKHQADLYFIASSQEEVSSLGAMTSAFNTEPDMAMILDVGFAHQPGCDREHTQGIDKPLVTVGPYLNPVLTKKLEEVAKRINVELQKEVSPRGTGTDTDAVAASRAGVPCVLIGIPVKNMHTAVEVLDLNTLEEAARLVAHFAAACEDSWEEELWN
ncbi:MAG: M20/M25/M40 family metallo-hydrolase [Christensenellales bacterium]|jgi:putative aminopeptidase FrvX